MNELSIAYLYHTFWEITNRIIRIHQVNKYELRNAPTYKENGDEVFSE
jgi:hypothetical protein